MDKKYDYFEAENNCREDIFKVYNSNKLGIYVKNHTLKVIELLWSMDYYNYYKSIFNNEKD